MRSILIILLGFLFSLTTFGQVNPNYHRVDGYFRDNGTYVKPHYRTNRNGTNRDNYTTRPNTNPHTGKRGYIERDNNYYNLPNTNSTSSSIRSTTAYKTSTASFFTNYGEGGDVKVWINGSYEGKISGYFPSVYPICGQNGTLTVNLAPGSYSYRAEDNTGFYWEGNFTASDNSCKSLHLVSSADRRYDLGIESAIENYRPSYLNYLVPFAVTSFNPYLGAVTTLTIDVFPPANSPTGDANYDQGYKRVAKRKIIIATVASFSLGFLTNRLIVN